MLFGPGRGLRLGLELSSLKMIVKSGKGCSEKWCHCGSARSELRKKFYTNPGIID
jgi:hypothetical protein